MPRTHTRVRPDGSVAPLDPDVLRAALASYPTGVAVVTAHPPQSQPVAMVVGTFSSASLDPPLVTYVPRRASQTHERLRAAEHFCVNLLAADQEDLCRLLESPGGYPLEELAWSTAPHGSPVLHGVVGWFECRWSGEHEVGDHYIVVGEVLSLAFERIVPPLLYYQRGYGRLQHGPLMFSGNRATIRAVSQAEPARAEVDRLAQDLGVECSVQCLVDDELLIVLSANRAPGRGVSRLGFIAPLVPPLGALFIAPDPARERDWLARLGPDRAALEPLVREQIARVRRRGWSMTLRGELGTEYVDQVVAAYSEGRRTPAEDEAFRAVVRKMVAAHEPDLPVDGTTHDLLQVSVPVTTRHGAVAFVLRLGSLPARATREDISWWVHRAQQAAALITESLPEV